MEEQQESELKILSLLWTNADYAEFLGEIDLLKLLEWIYTSD